MRHNIMLRQKPTPQQTEVTGLQAPSDDWLIRARRLRVRREQAILRRIREQRHPEEFMQHRFQNLQ